MDRLVDLERVRKRLAELSKIGAGSGGGINRLAFSEEDRRARQTVMRWMSELGLEVRVDPAGNMIGRRSGKKQDAPPLMLGSHIDSVPQGGAYDGCLGVVAALELVEFLNRFGLDTVSPVEVVSFQMEESSRFSLAMFGSRVMAGRFREQDLERLDQQGINLADCLHDFGFDPGKLKQAQRRAGEIGAYLELHIDQGKILKQLGKQVGIVTGIAAPARWLCTCLGESCHSGATLPENRRDALVAAAEIILEIERLALHYKAKSMVATVGMLQISPGVINVIPGKAELGLDIRGIDSALRQQLFDEICAKASRIAGRRGIELEWHLLSIDEPILLHHGWIQTIEDQCRNLSLDYEMMISLPAHDAMQIAHLAPTGMILVRNESGISHSPKEFIAPEDIAAGCELYCRSALAWLEVRHPALRDGLVS